MFREKNFSKELPGIFHSYAYYLNNHRGVSQENLAKHLCLNKSSVTRHMTSLENEGYIVRRPNPEDKREMLVFPTEKFDTELYPEVAKVGKLWREAIFSALTENEQELLSDLLEKVANKAKETALSEEQVK